MFITLSYQVRQWGVGPADGGVSLIGGTAGMMIQADTHTKVIGSEGDTSDPAHCVIVHCLRFVGGLEENLRHKRSTSSKKRTIGALTDRTWWSPKVVGLQPMFCNQVFKERISKRFLQSVVSWTWIGIRRSTVSVVGCNFYGLHRSAHL
jgi:hypothetical protein